MLKYTIGLTVGREARKRGCMFPSTVNRRSGSNWLGDSEQCFLINIQGIGMAPDRVSVGTLSGVNVGCAASEINPWAGDGE